MIDGIRATTVKARSTGAGAARAIAIAAALLCLATLAARWPGVAMYDSISQYEQATSGDFFDWHPPIMARTWALLIHIWPGTAPFLILQVALWWGGLGLLGAALARTGKAKAASAVLVVGALPLFVGWDTVVLKDAQLASCLVATMGLAAHFRFTGGAIPRWAVAAILVLLVYATLVRGNAVFATVPLALALFGWLGVRRWWMRGALTLGLILAVLVVGPSINHHLLGARASKVERALPLYDIAGIAHQAGLPTVAGATEQAWREGERKGCYTPYFWNPYGMPTQCESLGDSVAFDAVSGAPLMRAWITLVATHPIAWAEHRLRHFNSNIRFLVGRGQSDAAPPAGSEKNDDGLGAPPSGAGRALVTAASWMAATPLGWPFAWLALALALLGAIRDVRAPIAALGATLAFSALVMGASYALVSIASDLRYHLWSMLATALALVLLVAADALDRRKLRAGLVVVAILCLIGVAARIVLPTEPYPYPVEGKLSGSTIA
ncbi:hypothetical protein Q4F19_19920 [Sphingomonas sp. BIUV-7]|uniref:Glycosyltransferase RgtA/B/C/D-like domain-containing protein n=1 Tax=Sphingomonas natans TaxID=3063330 RepID=A0ABT8YE76_9SPHN|nr:hypothetical protein [Sphingomonas sp. BIUV-7]MDO6416662.1 hypothetical protein [Sphingomonas sp. BIUV-7]